MSGSQQPTHGVMEGKGAYNKHAIVQAAGAALAYKLLEEVAQNIDLGLPGQPVVIADYGSSQGKNSLAPVHTAIRALRARSEFNQPILVFHTDQPANDFNTLFDTLNSDPSSYSASDQNVFSCAIGKSFYTSVLPSDYVHIGWSSYAAMWLSRLPMVIPNHFFSVGSTGAVREAFDRQARQDWETFLTLRAAELKQNGRLVIVLPALNDDGSYGSTGLVDHANAGLAEMVEAGEITPDERRRMNVASHIRRREDLLAPFAVDGQFRGLRVEHCDVSEFPNPAWASFELHQDREILATDLAAFFRSTFIPSLAIALEHGHRAKEHQAFSDRLEMRLRQRLVRDPRPLMHSVATFVFVKNRR